MGKLAFHDWGRLLAMAAGTYYVWGGLWSIFFRKFFWDMIGGHLTPTGLQGPPSAQPFINIIVTIPLLPIIVTLGGLATLMLEYPLKGVSGTAIHRSLVFRAVLYLFLSMIGILVYQTVDAAVYFFITSLVYARAASLSEKIADPHAVRGRGGGSKA